MPALTMTVDELWLHRSPEQMAADFIEEARQRFTLIHAEVDAIPDDGAPVLVEGPQLLRALVPEPALSIVGSSELQRELLRRRGSLTHSATSDPELAFANRVRRDELLADELRPGSFEISSVEETERMVDAFVRLHAPDWAARPDRGDVIARRRFDNDAVIDQWRRYASHEPRAREGTLRFACECERPACDALVELSFEEAVSSARPFLAHS